MLPNAQGNPMDLEAVKAIQVETDKMKDKVGDKAAHLTMVAGLNSLEAMTMVSNYQLVYNNVMQLDSQITTPVTKTGSASLARE